LNGHLVRDLSTFKLNKSNFAARSWDQAFYSPQEQIAVRRVGDKLFKFGDIVIAPCPGDDGQEKT
jgi:hypothetical protein